MGTADQEVLNIYADVIYLYNWLCRKESMKYFFELEKCLKVYKPALYKHGYKQIF